MNNQEIIIEQIKNQPHVQKRDQAIVDLLLQIEWVKNSKVTTLNQAYICQLSGESNPQTLSQQLKFNFIR